MFTDGPVNDKVGRAVDDEKEVAQHDRNLNPDYLSDAATVRVFLEQLGLVEILGYVE